jgi:hypothetical protein
MGKSINKKSPYAGKVAALTTLHEKDRGLSHPMRRIVGLEVSVVDWNTDKLGTFSGEKERIGSPLDVALKKAKTGIKISGIPLGIANEGSFGPHPAIPFVQSDFEILVFVDKENKLEVVETLQSLETNLSYCTPTKGENISDFLKKAKFGSHALVVHPNEGDKYSKIYKGIKKIDELEKVISICAALSPDGKAHVETDMRAHMNPTRMKVIRKLGYRMAKRLLSRCPKCFTPGWGFVDKEIGLPCEWCAVATNLVSKEIFGCSKCKHLEKRNRSDGKVSAERQYCPECNP